MDCRYIMEENKAQKQTWRIVYLERGSDNAPFKQDDFLKCLSEVSEDIVILADKERVSENDINDYRRQFFNQKFSDSSVAYVASGKQKLHLGIFSNQWCANHEITDSPLLMGRKDVFLKAYGGSDLGSHPLVSVGYSLQKVGGLRFVRLNGAVDKLAGVGKWQLWKNYTWKIPGQYLLSGMFFRHLFSKNDKVQRDMLFRMLLILFACFAFVFMPYVSQDYGVTGDEFVDHRHAGYVLDYFAKGDKAALNQPQTTLHLYGNAVQVVTAAICRWFDVENYYELRHFCGGLIGALGVLAAGLLGLRWGGGLCGLFSILLMFFTPRFFGHSMNNLKDVPFAVGYVLSLFYTVRLFDYFPIVKVRHALGLVVGIALALGTRSGGLILYPMLLMYAGLFYIGRSGGLHEFLRFKKHGAMLGNILQLVLLVIIASYLLGIALWPFALANPLRNVVYSLTKFTNYSIGLRTIFDGEQMMSNMLPWQYAPKFICIGMPVVMLIGFFGYFLYAGFRKREFSLISFFLFFAAVFPVFWVIYQNSNLYGGIRHLLFVIPPMVVLGGRFWSGMVHWVKGYGKVLVVGIFLCLLSLPALHMIKNHPNEYVYFNEFKGGLDKAYGYYETDYYFNSLKESAEWFGNNVLPDLPKDKKTIIVTQASNQLAYYFRNDTNIRVAYSRYYEKYCKDWDYAIFGNVYIGEEQLRNGLFPLQGTLFAPEVDGYPMSFVAKRDCKTDLEGFKLEKERKFNEALKKFEEYVEKHPNNEEVWARMGKLYYVAENLDKAKIALENALLLHPGLNEALYVSALLYIDLKDYPKALKSADGMLAENKLSADGWYLRALVFYEQKKYQESIVALNRLLAFRPKYDKAHILAGDIFRDTGNFGKAYQLYEVAAKVGKAASSYVKMADMLVRQKEYSKANGILEQLLKAQPSYYPVYKVKCRMALQEGKMEEAGEYLTKMNELNDDSELYVLRCLYYRGINDTVKADLMLEGALKVDSGNVEALKLKQEMN